MADLGIWCAIEVRRSYMMQKLESEAPVNVKELKKLAEKWDHSARGSMTNANAAWAMYKAIMALPDDPPADHQDLVEMARDGIKENTFHVEHMQKLANAVIDRFGKKEPRKVECFAIICDGKVVSNGFVSREEVQAYKERYYKEKGYWIAKVIATEEV